MTPKNIRYPLRAIRYGLWSLTSPLQVLEPLPERREKIVRATSTQHSSQRIAHCRYLIVGILLLLGFSSSGQATLGGTAGSADPLINSLDKGSSPPVLSSSPSLLSRFSVLAGVSIYTFAAQSFEAPAMAARYAVSEKWSVEAGGSLDTRAGYDFRNDQRGNFNNALWIARVDSASEIHLAGIYNLPHGTQSWAIPELSLGISELILHNVVQTAAPNPSLAFYDSPTTHAWSPTVGLGLHLFAKSPVSLNLDAAWASYQNTVDEASQTFNLGLNGLMYTAMLELRL